MFTGIIREIGVIKKTAVKDGNLVIQITCNDTLKDLKTGDSVNINGICSTVSGIASSSIEVNYMPETQKITTTKEWCKDYKVNLEPALKLSDNLNGHLVTGHVDFIGIVKSINTDDKNFDIDIKFPKEYSKFIALKGSVTINGVSLTVSFLDEDFFRVSLIPFTINHTTLGSSKKNDRVNIEIDLISRYLLRLFDERDNQTSYEFLKERGFI